MPSSSAAASVFRSKLGKICLGLAVLASLLWLWINFCRFPDYAWNDIRLLPVFMAASGESVYSLPGSGVLTTWMYGPIPIWLWSPALWGQSAISALLIADGTNIAISVAAIALTCAYWPVAKITRGTRWLALAGAIAIWPDHTFRFLQADNIAIACALIGNLLLVTASDQNRDRRLWIVAATTAVALGCKQNALGILVAQSLWLAGEYDRKIACSFLIRSLLVGTLLASIAIWQFGFAELWFGIVTIAAQLPSTEDPAQRMLDITPQLIVHWGLPLIAGIVIGKKVLIGSHPLRLPFLAFLCSLPLGMIGLLSTGGSLNNLQGLHLILIPLILVALHHSIPYLKHFHRPLTCALIIGCLSLRVLHSDHAPILPNLRNVETATALQEAYPHQLWLPWNPLVSYFVEDRFYHSEDGIYVRFITGHSVSLTQAKAYLPDEMQIGRAHV